MRYEECCPSQRQYALAMDLAVVASDDLFAFATGSTKLQRHLVALGRDELVDVGKLNLWMHNMVHDCPSGSDRRSTELQQLNMSNVHGDFDSFHHCRLEKIASKNITR